MTGEWRDLPGTLLERCTMKVQLISLLLLIAQTSFSQTTIHSPGSSTPPSGSYAIPVIWEGDSLGGGWNPHAALLLPISLKGSPRAYYMQFDLGAPYTLFYKEQLESLSKRHPGSLFPATDTISSIGLLIGSMNKTFKSVPVKSFPSSVAPGEGKQIPIIGTLGADWISDKVLIFDYPQGQIILSDTTPANFPRPVHRFYFAGGRIFFPATIGGKQTLIYFDTGSSAFELLTDSASWRRMAEKNSVPISYPVSSWGKWMTAHTVQSSDSIGMAGLQIPVRRVTYMEGADTAQVTMMQKMGIGAVSGNVLFLDYTLILDMKQQLFALVGGATPLPEGRPRSN
jgi:hypothetical protein